MPLQRLLWNYLIIVPHILLLAVLVLLVRRKLYRQFPIFLAYVAEEVLQFAVLFPMLMISSVTPGEYAAAKVYAIGYSVGLALSTGMRFGVIHEIFAHTFRNYAAFGKFGRPAFRVVTVALLLGGLMLAAYHGGHDARRLMSVVHVLDRAASILQCGLLICLFFFSSSLGLSWRSHVFGIALGLGVFAGVELISSAIRAQTGHTYSLYLNYLTMATYHCCVLIWAFYLWVPERAAQFAVKTMPEHDLEKWNRELQHLLRQ